MPSRKLNMRHFIKKKKKKKGNHHLQGFFPFPVLSLSQRTSFHCGLVPPQVLHIWVLTLKANSEQWCGAQSWGVMCLLNDRKEPDVG